MIRWTIGLCFWHYLKDGPFKVCELTARDEKEALARAWYFLGGKHNHHTLTIVSKEKL